MPHYLRFKTYLFSNEQTRSLHNIFVENATEILNEKILDYIFLLALIPIHKDMCLGNTMRSIKRVNKMNVYTMKVFMLKFM